MQRLSTNLHFLGHSWQHRIIWLIAACLGFGVYPLLALPLIVMLFIDHTDWIARLHSIWSASNQKQYIIIFCVFFGVYWLLYTPYQPNRYQMPWAYFPILFALSILTLLSILCLQKISDLINFIWFFSIGALIFCLATVGSTFFFKQLPFYGAVIDIRYLVIGQIKYINTPGIANLLALFPCVFLAGLILPLQQRPMRFWLLGIGGFVLSFIAAICIEQRSYFLLVIFIAPIVVGFFFIAQKIPKLFLIAAIFLLAYFLINLFNQFFDVFFSNRSLNGSLFQDSRFVMLGYWLNHFLQEPFQRIAVGPEPWNGYAWFHNFFADIHRLSGFWGLLMAVMLVGYIFLRVLYLMKVNKRLGLFLMAIWIFCFLILNTSVVPEGERQPFLLLLAIGGIAEVLSRRKTTCV